MDMDRQKLLNMLGLCRISGNLVDLPFDKSEMGKAMGFGERSVAAVTDKGLADSLRQMIHKVMGE